jgi:SPP1 gp7 family putative phage head morphogenesis protein
LTLALRDRAEPRTRYGVAAESRAERLKWARARQAEHEYARQLRAVARRVGSIVDLIADTQSVDWVLEMLERYAERLTPWAEATAARMLADVSRRDVAQWNRVSATMSRALREEIATAPTGEALRRLLSEQVGLIKSLPREAGQRVHKLATEAKIATASRGEDLVQRILETGHVTESRAILIARTETARVASNLTQVRAQHIGSTHYEWMTAGDHDVRPFHKALNKTLQRWDSPPVCEPTGERANPGCIWNCFSGDTLVSSPSGVRRVWRSFYDGQIIGVQAGGIEFLSTPNHPVLTSRGWVAVGALDEGDYLVQMAENAAFVSENDENNVEATFEQISMSGVSRMHDAGPVEFNFHGDIPQGNVDEIAFEFPLSGNVVAHEFERSRNLFFANAYGGVRDIVDRVRSLYHISESRLSRFGDELNAAFSGHFGHADMIRFAPGSALGSVFPQYSRYDDTLEPVLFGDSKFTHTRDIVGNDIVFRRVSNPVVRGPSRPYDLNTASPEFLAKIIGRAIEAPGGLRQAEARGHKFLRVEKKFFREFKSHVYTLESGNGWYGITSARIPAKNCRCVAIPIIPDLNRLGA